MLQRHNLLPPEGGQLYGATQRPWWQSLSLDACEQLLVAQDLQMLDQLAPLIKQTEVVLHQLSVCEPWAAHVPYLVQQTGVGILTAMTLLAAIGDIMRFPHPQQLVGYAGLGASVHDSGQTHSRGGITKQGRRELRASMVEAAWTAVRYNVHWKCKYKGYTRRMKPSKAIVAIARQMLVSVR